MPETEDKLTAEKWMKSNRLAQFLLEKSDLSREELKTMLLYYWSGGTTFEDLAQKMRIQRPGAWKRWRRSLDTIMRSFYTIELAMYAGILDSEIADIISQDLQDYASLAREEGGLEEIQSRIEERMVKLRKIVPSKRGTT
ncbi:MAG: hypothetical protein MUO36_02840 [Candidatus Hadarchaeum sp.]|jgi:hypothetical protein|nr:hypothetical protein [Candidatus Hadarchaeum sp.]